MLCVKIEDAHHDHTLTPEAAGVAFKRVREMECAGYYDCNFTLTIFDLLYRKLESLLRWKIKHVIQLSFEVGY